MTTISSGQIVKRAKYSLFALLLLVGFSPALAQEAPTNQHVLLGQKALLDGDFKAASGHLQKAMSSEGNDPNVVYMLGYSQYHCGEYQKALTSFEKVVKLRPDDVAAYYYRGKANNLLAVQTNTRISSANREKMLEAAISDYTTAISLNSDDVKLFQNRGIAYRDLGILQGTTGTANYNKERAAGAYDKSIADFKQVLALTPGKKDIETEIRKAQVYRDNLK